ncbi:uncharacterized protein TM35_000113110 [Trypanosoma theileri]|uniref:Uncharacterized protein n=1 Tax=Trypanosoma theileri TaxID=67003 RepID=A0A1X0NYM7_9TRYP|nr:uncharacterized protein TM35_000113110 [Trypanosoma theileri]ORC89777.1 hypothetical protein TM35_000113110 [Trypanosoma theileri]
MTLPPDAVPLAGAKNVSVAVRGTTLHIFCDLTRDYGISGSGKSVVIASSGGNRPLGATNAFVGLNIFCKAAAARCLDAAGVAALREWTELGTAAQWRVHGPDSVCKEEETTTREDNGKNKNKEETDKDKDASKSEGWVLEMAVDFARAGDKVASSGKSVLLSSTGGNKAVAKTGIICGMNCYIPIGKELQLDRLNTIVGSPQLANGEVRDLGNGFQVEMISQTQAIVHCEYTQDDSAATKTMPSFTLNGEITIATMVKSSRKKRKGEEQTEVKKDNNGDTSFTAPSQKSKNLLVRCTRKNKDDNDDDTILVDFQFDPTQTQGHSASGKSITVATSGGWCEIGKGLSISFNAYKSAPPVATEEIVTSVAKVLDARSPEEIASLSLKTVITEVSEKLGIENGATGPIKEQVKHAVMDYMSKVGKSSNTVPAAVREAVVKILSTRTQEELATLSLKTVMAEVSQVVEGELADDSGELKEQVKTAVMDFLRKNVK